MSGKKSLIALLSQKDLKVTAAGLDWDSILEVAEYSKVSALLFRAIKDLKEKIPIPDSVYFALNDRHQKNVIRNALVLEEFDKLSSLFEKEGVPLVLLKGIYFLLGPYRSCPGIRRMEDIDILVKEEDAQKASYIIESLGFVCPEDGIRQQGARKARMYIRREMDGSVLAPVHLHRHFINLSGAMYTKEWSLIDMEEVWADVRPVQEDKSGFLLSMCPEHMLLALCIHGLSHGFARLNILYDLYSFMLRYKVTLDRDKLVLYAGKWGLSIPLYIGMRLLRDMFHSDIPEGLLGPLKPKGLMAGERLFMKYVKTRDFPGEDMGTLLYIGMNRGFCNRLSYLLKGLSLRVRKGCGLIS